MLKRTDSQVQAARRIIEHAAEYLQADLSVKLWDGTIVPLGRQRAKRHHADRPHPRPRSGG